MAHLEPTEMNMLVPYSYTSNAGSSALVGQVAAEGSTIGAGLANERGAPDLVLLHAFETISERMERMSESLQNLAAGFAELSNTIQGICHTLQASQALFTPPTGPGKTLSRSSRRLRSAKDGEELRRSKRIAAVARANKQKKGKSGGAGGKKRKTK